MVSLKAVVTALAAWVTLVQAVPVGSEQSSALTPRASAYSSVNGLYFDIDGVTRYFAGTNSYWIGFLTNNADVDLVMTHLQTSGLKVLRVWGFNDVTNTENGVWFQSFITGQAPQINTGTNGLQRLDYVVTSAAAHDIKLVINFVNNWGDYGGMPLYNTYYGTNKTTWYTTPAVQTQYKAYIAAVVSRYTTSTSVFAWELANEPRCNGCPTSIVTNWATTISAYIKSLDSNHMVTLGDEGFMNGGGDGSYPYTTAEGIDFAQNLKVPDLDYGTFHMYPQSWGVANSFGGPWITNHGAACVAAGKPCVLEEYGSTSDHVATEAPWQATALSTPGIAGDMFWQWGDDDSNGQTANDGYTIYYGSAEWTSLVVDHVAAIPAGTGTYTPPATSSMVSTSSMAPTTSVTTPTTSCPALGTSTVTVTVTSTIGAAPTTSVVKPTTTSTPTSTTPPATPTSVATAAHWAQCGGTGYTGPTVCASPYTCTFSNTWYSQCL